METQDSEAHHACQLNDIVIMEWSPLSHHLSLTEESWDSGGVYVNMIYSSVTANTQWQIYDLEVCYPCSLGAIGLTSLMSDVYIAASRNKWM